MFDFINGSLQYVGSPLSWVDFGISAFIIIIALIILLKVVKQKVFFAIGCVLFVLIFTGWLFSLSLLWVLSLVIMAILIAVVLIYNQAEIRTIIVKFLKNKGHRNDTEKVFDRHALYQKVAIAVENLSKNRIGAIITFERSTSLSEFVKSGTVLNSPVTPELLVTIFYPGTRLHDGAVVIRRDLIHAASVYYTPTTKPLTGKYGSRHRAAIGISEVSDSVTIVVSEETGRISLAIGGELIHVAVDNFIRTFEDYMFANDDISGEKADE